MTAALLDRARQLQEQGKLTEAEIVCRQILSGSPRNSEALHLLGVVAYQLGRTREGAEFIRRAIEIDPDRAQFHSNLGLLLSDLDREAAITAFERALQLQPDFEAAATNLARLLAEMDRVDQAIEAYRKVVRINPRSIEGHFGLAYYLRERGEMEPAVEHYRTVVQLDPDNNERYSGYLYSLYFDPRVGQKQILEEHRIWATRNADRVKRVGNFGDWDRKTDRVLNLGYVSPDFRAHPVGRFMLPLLEAHDRKQFKIFCYDVSLVHDSMTSRLAKNADVWRKGTQMSDQDLARTIAEDRIDILVDLTMHTAFNRELVFARKPAPVQMCYLAYQGTTGLEAMDYRITDPFLETPEMARGIYTEESVWLKTCYWCYRPWQDCPEVQPLPASRNPWVTFGSFNSFWKVSAGALEVWAKILAQVPQSRMVMLAPEGKCRQRVRENFARFGVNQDRIEFVNRTGLPEYLSWYGGIDIALDPFPYAGGTTTCDALWMGVPVVTLAQKTAIGRGGVTIMKNVGLPEMVAESEEEYVRKAVELARDHQRLGAMRTGLRDKMRSSPLMDSGRFAAEMEGIYRDVWKKWCARAS
jgi:protein O-GlcNAc transferase